MANQSLEGWKNRHSAGKISCSDEHNTKNLTCKSCPLMFSMDGRECFKALWRLRDFVLEVNYRVSIVNDGYG